MENIQHEYFIWEEKNLTDLNQNSLKKEKSVKESSIIETKNGLTQKDWRDITNPKERKKAYNKEYNKAYREVNKDKIRLKQKDWNENNKERLKVHKKNWCEDNKDKIKAYRELNKDKIKAYKEVNKDEIKVQQKAWFKANEDKIKAYKEVNKDKIKLRNKAYRQVNKDKIKVYKNNKLKTDIQHKLSHNLRSRLCCAINNNQKAGSAVRDLGCTIDELKSYLESKFLTGMSWDNWTTDGWHIDHIKPLASFDLTDRKQFLEACHYTNLQPLWATDNLTKSDKIL
jgi:hypothetical protein